MAAKKSGVAGKAALVATAAAAAAAGYYFYGSGKAKKHRSAASRWAKGLKADVVRGAKALKQVNRQTVSAVVDEAVKVYKAAKGVSQHELHHAAKELKGNWHHIKGEIAAKATSGAKKVKSVAKKSVGKVKRGK